MERLLSDAEKISGVKYDISSYADITQAIHVMQEEMGIAGTTAKEAESTISGSVQGMKASWENLLVGLSDGTQDIQPLIQKFVDSVGIVAKNIMPIATQAIMGVSGLIETLLPLIMQQIPVLVNEILPQLLESATTMSSTFINGLIDGMYSGEFDLSGILSMLVDSISTIAVDMFMLGTAIIDNLLSGLNGSAGSIMESIGFVMDNIIETILVFGPDILQNGINLIVQLALGLAQGIPQMLPRVIDIVMMIVMTLIQNAPMLIQAALQLIIGLTTGLIQALPQLIEMLPGIVIAIVQALILAAPLILEASIELIKVLAIGLYETAMTLDEMIRKIIQLLIDKFLAIKDKFMEVGEGIVDGIWKGIEAGWTWLTNKVADLAQSLLDAAKNVLGIHSPSKEFAWIGQMSAQGMIVGFDDVDPVGVIKSSLIGSLGNIQTNVSAMDSSRNGTMSNAISNIASASSYAGDLVFRIGESEVARTLLQPLLSEMNRQGYDVSVIGG